MARYVGLHTIPGFTREMLAEATPALEAERRARFLRAYTSFSEGKVVCEWDAPDRDTVAGVYGTLGFPFDQIVQVDAICDNGNDGVDTRWL